MTLYIGLISGTSMDGVEAVALEIQSDRFQVRSAIHHEYPADIEARLRRAVASPEQCTVDEYGDLDAAVGNVFADAALQLLQFSGFPAKDIRAIGSHGQTLLHRPRATVPFTLQIGDANRIAERTEIDVVADFRRRDMAAGGEGAPLVPAFHAAAFATTGVTRVVVNIGGIANITILPASGAVVGFDTGPGNCLMDLWAKENLGTPFDRDGAMAASAAPDGPLLQRMLAEPYLARPFPKSTGRELFHRGWIESVLAGGSFSAQVVQSTLCEFTAVSIASAIAVLAKVKPTEVLVCGGGAYNGELMRRLAARLPLSRVASTANYGIAPEHVEAALFAWLAKQFVEGQPGNLTTVTGAQGPRILGALHKGSVTKR
jgi:anhydro-N-acetylmuramic acid kinase